jgi:hypothetical protein
VSICITNVCFALEGGRSPTQFPCLLSATSGHTTRTTGGLQPRTAGALQSTAFNYDY